MKKLEQLQQEKLGIGYIKSYPILKQLPITPIQIEILQLVLSYQSNNQDFYMNYDKISEILSSTNNSITKNISILNKNNYIQTNHTSNYNGKDGGSSTSIKVNMDYIIKLLTQDNSKELSNQNDTNIPQEEIKPLKSNNIEIEKQVEMKAEELDKLLTERQNGDYSSTKDVIVDYETTLMGDKVLIKIDDDLIVFYNEHVIEDTQWVYKYMKKKTEYIANNNLRNKKELYEQYQRDLDKVNNKN